MTEDFRVLADRRIAEAKILLAANEASGAYYLAGYSIECSLKACILKGLSAYYMPPKTLVAESHIHDLDGLIKVAGIKGDYQRMVNTNPNFNVNWNIVKDWNESSRYESRSLGDATDIIDAIDDPTDGVLAWTKTHW